MSFYLKQLPTFFLAFIIFSVKATVIPNSLIGDHAVLQRGVQIPVWGTAGDGESVTVEMAGRSVATYAASGKWMVVLEPLPAGGPYTMTIRGYENTVKVHDILIGEVWVCSGQSNMARQLGPIPNQRPVENCVRERDAANYPRIREYFVRTNYSHNPVEDAKGKWVVCSPQTVSLYSAVGYFFAKEIHLALNVPVGMIFSAVGGTSAEQWTDAEVLKVHPELKDIVDRYDQAVHRYPRDLEAYKKNERSLFAKFQADSTAAIADGKPMPRKPQMTEDPSLRFFPGGLYNGMIAPLRTFAIKGVIWYQGETNNNRPEQYRILFPQLIKNWRDAWAEKAGIRNDFPFLFVQIAPHKSMSPELREAQLESWQSVKNTAMAVTTDCGDANDIHPVRKQPVGIRLSLAARALAYNQKVEYSGPVYKSMVVKGNKAVLGFSHVGKGLTACGDDLKGFEIKDRLSGAYVPAQAKIKGRKVVVSSLQVEKPVAVRFGWANVPEVNFFNRDGLPASPFRTMKD
jgi:sialate O-acetylesterase